MSGLVYIGGIIVLSNIEGADRIESAYVVCGHGGKWQGVVQKGQFKVGDLCMVYLQDSLVPQTPEFGFMERYHWRVKMARFKGVPSECVIMPLTTIVGDIGTDVTELAGVTKYEKPVPAHLAGQMMGVFPSHLVPKTDEPNFQAVPELVAALMGRRYVATVKVDGTSVTVYRYNDHVGVCSRNWEMQDKPGSAHWQIAHEYRMPEELLARPGNLALQFELVGPGIQANPLGLTKLEPRLFNVYDIDGKKYLSNVDVAAIGIGMGIPVVEWAEEGPDFHYTSEELRKLAEGTYPNGRQREGIVIRPWVEEMVGNERLSFKVINLLYRD